VYTYRHHSAIHSVDTQCYLFSADDPAASVQLSFWKIFNYPLGNGSFGFVNVCEHVEGGLQAACKTINARNEPDWRYKFKQEVEIMKRMDHPNVVRVLDQIRVKRKGGRGNSEQGQRAEGQYRGGEMDDEEEVNAGPECHLVLELVTGGDLFSYYEKSDGLSEDEVRWFAWQLVLALEYIHSQGVAHRGELAQTYLSMRGRA
jgi:calcium-dependent protein kinase